MNYRMTFRIVGRVLCIEALLMLLPLITALIYGESAWCFVWTILITVALGLLLSGKEPENKTIYAAEGFVGVALAWIAMSVVGALPYVFSGAIPSYIDALFETVSGFTTTGSSIVSDVEALPNGISFWRCFTHWIGGMGVLVFVMAVMPLSEEHSMHIMRAEVPGPVVGKLVPRVRHTAIILYLIYVVMTLILAVLLWLGGMSFFDGLIHAFSTAGTGGFSNKALSIGYYDSLYIELVISVFELLFGINFNLYFLLLLKKFGLVFKNEELLVFLGIVLTATLLISLSLWVPFGGFLPALRAAFFHVCTVITTTGFCTADFSLWSPFACTVLLLIMICGACAGSTGGGIKISRVIIIFKSIMQELRRQLRPRSVSVIKCNGKPVDRNTIICTEIYVLLYCLIVFVSMLLISLNGLDITTNLSAVITCLSNVGPGLELLGPACNFGMLAAPSKLLLSLCMLLGRLEIYPVLMLFMPMLYRR